NNVFQTWVLHDPRAVESLKRETMEGWFLDFLPDLNQHDEEVSRYLIQNTLWWIGTTGLDGIRMDTWQYVPNSFWRDWNRALKQEFPDFRVVGEVKDGDVVHTSFFQGGRVRFDGVDSGLDSLLDFPLFYPIRHAFAEGKPVDEIPKTLAKDFLYTNSEILVTLLGGHDDGRFMSEKGATIAGLKLANALVLTTRGVPQLYYGDEIAMEGGDEPATRGDFPGGFAGDKRNAFTAAGRTKDEQELFEYIRRLAEVRRDLEPLQTGELINLYVSEQQYAYARSLRGNAVVVVFNNDDKAVEFEFDVARLGLRNNSVLRDHLDVSRDIAVRDRKLRVSLPKRSAAIFSRRRLG
ncbi:MAG TPA: alpha-amylase family glycosyl hydrolase, partial [Pyrinomonadaceae bacterium]|nr:alpha-amylase family glycosyl hydrolase [Pyrinomonadaceae bacterium]